MSENVDPITGEVLPPAADGRPVAPAASMLSQLIAVMGEGEFDRCMASVLSNIVEGLRDFATAGDGTGKAKLAITLDIKIEGGAFFITPSHKVTMPTEKYGRALMFATEDGRFTPNPPYQGQLFGVRDATPAATRIR